METQTAEWYHHMLPFIIVLTIFELGMKLIAMWRAGRKNQLAWFIVIGLINTAGILPIIYLILNRKNKTEED